jgi:hypothetical protein
MAEDKQESESMLGELSGRIALFIGTLYTIGLIIVDVDLARYGIVNAELARPEYIVVGGLWLLLSASAAAVIESPRASRRRESRIGFFKHLSVGIAYLGIFLLLFSWLPMTEFMASRPRLR